VEPAPACGKPGTGIQATENALDSGLRRNDAIVLRISDSGH
jgi:hypothetical protein